MTISLKQVTLMSFTLLMLGTLNMMSYPVYANPPPPHYKYNKPFHKPESPRKFRRVFRLSHATLADPSMYS